MSDDEEYYDDDADWMWFDDGERELADDLAEGTMHSPVYMDHGVYDAIDSASDWDYYTDEYFDDDLSVMRTQSLASTTSSQGTAGKKKKSKRKQGEQQRVGNDTVNNNKGNPNSFCRILWRSSGYLVDQGELYEPGKGEKVALLKNWREIFKDSQPKRDHRLQKSASASSSSSSSSPSRVLPQSLFPKSVAGRKQPGRSSKTEKRNAGVKIDRVVDLPVFDSERVSEEGSEWAGGEWGGRGDGDDDDGGDGGDGQCLTPPPSFLSASQQEIYEKSRKKAAAPPRRSDNDKDHNRQPGSHLKSVMPLPAQGNIPDPPPTLASSPSSPSTATSNRRSVRPSTAPTTNSTSITTRPSTSIVKNGEPGELSSSLQDGYAADIADNVTPVGKGNSPPAHRQRRKRKACSPVDNCGRDQDGGNKSKRATTKRRLDDSDHDDRYDAGSQTKTKEVLPATTTNTTRRILRERKK
ncbi:hypothetical protein AJ78_07371 [Emergomyces pasteurianus Ep9510]|uniref:Uncharacterized protein n=1 Tax=Emergomyces pasteurianus Ep9510 TaxID=1447872 RepID=A0A1J9P7U1_9EURO|nr:hypothetical protein AJ78_07371 [Emergomyces pasteurianus Ep9510]